MKHKGGKRRKLTNECWKAVCDYQDEHARATYKDIQSHIHESENVDLSISSISRILKVPDEGVPFSTKNLTLVHAERNTPENVEFRKEYCAWAASVDENDLVFIDEFGANLHTYRKRGRARIGKRAEETVPGQKGANVSIIAAISPTNGLIHYKASLESTDSDVFAGFMNELFTFPRFQQRILLI